MGRLIGSVGLAPGSDEGTDLTTKGDIHGFSSSNTRIPISTNNFSLLCDSSEALGLKWAASPTSVLTTTGDLLYASGANTLARLAASGTSGTVLTSNGAGAAPSYQAAGGGSDTTIKIQTADQTVTSSTTYVNADDINGITMDANSLYFFDLIMFVSSNATADFKWQFTGTGITIKDSYGSDGFASFSNYQTNMANGNVAISDTSAKLCRWYGTLTVDGSERSLSFQFAQNVSNGVDTILKSGSTLLLYKGNQ